jgi:hypothetical protein
VSNKSFVGINNLLYKIIVISIHILNIKKIICNKQISIRSEAELGSQKKNSTPLKIDFRTRPETWNRIWTRHKKKKNPVKNLFREQDPKLEPEKKTRPHSKLISAPDLRPEPGVGPEKTNSNRLKIDFRTLLSPWTHLRLGEKKTRSNYKLIPGPDLRLGPGFESKKKTTQSTIYFRTRIWNSNPDCPKKNSTRLTIDLRTRPKPWTWTGTRKKEKQLNPITN